MRETLEDIRKKLKEGVYKNEEHVRLSLVARILNDLGWDIWNPSEVSTEFVAVPNEDSTRVDFALFATPIFPSVYIEVKGVGRLQAEISRLEYQLRDYNRNNTATFTILTDGKQWRFYFSQTGGTFPQKLFKVLDILSDELDELESSFETFLAKRELGNDSARRVAEGYLQLNQRQRAMEDVLVQARRMTAEPPYPSLPQAITTLVASLGFTISPDEVIRFLEKATAQKQTTPKPTLETVTSPQVNSRDGRIPTWLEEIIEVCDEVFWNNQNYNKAVQIVARKRNLTSVHTVYNACTRAIGLNTAQFRRLLEDKPALIKFLSRRFPAYSDEIRERLLRGSK